MYATIRSYAGGSALIDAILKSEDEVKDLMGGIDGFQAYYMLRTADGDAISISVFDDQAGAEESTRAAAAWVRENAPELSLSPPQVSGGEVAVSA
jgi:hypothetical protein